VPRGAACQSTFNNYLTLPTIITGYLRFSFPTSAVSFSFLSFFFQIFLFRENNKKKKEIKRGDSNPESSHYVYSKSESRRNLTRVDENRRRRGYEICVGDDVVVVFVGGGDVESQRSFELVVRRKRISDLAGSYLPCSRCSLRNRFPRCCGTFRFWI